MNGIVANWLTTVPGVVTLLIVFWNAWQTKTIDLETLRTALVGVGLVAAKDFNVTGISKK
ncbi:MAG: hypothetical protein EB015_16230 [Methylocystaceae bacterium]|nr:hypothetical protein [Methylocystaceae bacterium]